jgi:hypothetical protein
LTLVAVVEESLAYLQMEEMETLALGTVLGVLARLEMSDL